MPKQHDISINIGANVTGVQAIDSLAAELRRLGRQAGDSAPEVERLADELDAISSQQALIDQFKRQKRALAEAAAAMETAKREAEQLGRQMAQTANPTERMLRQFERVREEARKSAQAYRDQQIRLQRLRDRMRDAGLSTTALADSQRALNARLRVTREEAKKLQNRIAQMGADSKRAGEQMDSGFSRARRGITSISEQMRNARKDLLGLVGAAQLLDFGRDLAAVADQWSQINARLRQTTESQDEFNRVQTELFRIAQDTRSSLAANVTLYARIADSVRALGGDTEDAIRLTETIAKALQLSGASAAEAAAAQLQLAQALGSGVLRGDEFNSVMEASPRLVKALAEGLGVAVGELRGLAEQGELTADRVIGALLKQKQTIDQEYADLPVTVGGALQRLENQWLKLIGTQDEASGATRQLAEAIQLFADNLDAVLATAVTVGNAATIAARTVTLAVFNMASQVANALDTLTFGAIDSLHAHATALKETVNAIAGDIQQDFNDIADAWKSVGQAADLTNEQIVTGTSRATDSLSQAGDAARQAGLKFERFGAQADTVSSALDKLGIDATAAATGLSQNFIELTAAFDRLAQSGEASTEVLNAAAAKLFAQARSAEELSAALTRLERAQQGQTLTAKQQAAQYAEILQKLSALNAAERRRVVGQSQLAQAAVAYAKAQQSALEADIRSARTQEQLAAIQARAVELNRQEVLSDEQLLEIKRQLRQEQEALAQARERELALQRQQQRQQQDLNQETERGADTTERLKDSTEKAGDAAARSSAQFMNFGAVVREQFARTSQAAAEMFSRWRREIAQTLINTTDFWSDITRAQRLVQGTIDNARVSYEALIRTIRSGNLSLDQLDRLAATAKRRFEILGEEKLTALRDAIADARQKLIDTQEEAARTREALRGLAERLRDELDRIDGNRAAIEDRRYQRQLERIAELEKKGGEAARREAEQARRLAEELHRRKLAQIRQEQEARRRSETQPPAGGKQSQVQKVIRVDFGAGRKLDIPADQEQAFLRLLEQFKRVAS